MIIMMTMTEWVIAFIALVVSGFIHELGHWGMLKIYGVDSKIIVRGYGLGFGTEIIGNRRKGPTMWKEIIVAASGGIFAFLVFMIFSYYIWPNWIVWSFGILHLFWAIYETSKEYNIQRKSNKKKVMYSLI